MGNKPVTAQRHNAGQGSLHDNLIAEDAKLGEKYEITSGKDLGAGKDTQIKHGQLKKFTKTETGFWHREAKWWALYNQFYHSSTAPQQVDNILTGSRKFYNQFVEEMGDNFVGSYTGYIDHDSEPTLEKLLERYYGGNAKRLAEIKQTRDPDNRFELYIPTQEALQSLVASAA